MPYDGQANVLICAHLWARIDSLASSQLFSTKRPLMLWKWRGRTNVHSGLWMQLEQSNNVIAT